MNDNVLYRSLLGLVNSASEIGLLQSIHQGVHVSFSSDWKQSAEFVVSPFRHSRTNLQGQRNSCDRKLTFASLPIARASVKMITNKELSAAFRQAFGGSGKLIVPVMLRKCQPPPILAASRWPDLLTMSNIRKTCLT
jgi:hypothetical protein